jgi:hypothetical protein
MKMKNILIAVILVCCEGAVFAEDIGAQMRFSTCRKIWETNAFQCVRSARGIIGHGMRAEKGDRLFGEWFVDFLNYPDITDTNRVEEVLLAKEVALLDFASSPGIIDNTNVWFAAADFLGRLRKIKDSRWIVDSARVKSGFINGVTICANTNSLLYFNAYRRMHPNANYRIWKKMIVARQRREYTIARMERKILQTFGEFYWRLGARELSQEAKEICRHEIIHRAQLTKEEANDIFSGERYKDVPLPNVRN